jgi:hypothetical protein
LWNEHAPPGEVGTLITSQLVSDAGHFTNTAPLLCLNNEATKTLMLRLLCVVGLVVARPALHRRNLSMRKREPDSPLTGAVDDDEPSDIGLDWYDLFLTQTFPASDALQLW